MELKWHRCKKLINKYTHEEINYPYKDWEKDKEVIDNLPAVGTTCYFITRKDGIVRAGFFDDKKFFAGYIKDSTEEKLSFCAEDISCWSFFDF